MGSVSNEIAVYDEHPLRPSKVARTLATTGTLNQGTWTLLANIAQTVAGTDFVPASLRNNPPSILACLLYGHDLGLPPMVALREITMIDGKPSLSAALVTARVRERGHKMWWDNIYDGDGMVVGVTAYGRRADTGDEGEFTFTLAMAKQAGILRNAWMKYPQAMCWARAATQLARMLFSDVFLGHPVYTPEELGADEFEGPGEEPEAVRGRPSSVSAAVLGEPSSSPVTSEGEALQSYDGHDYPPSSGDDPTASPASSDHAPDAAAPARPSPGAAAAPDDTPFVAPPGAKVISDAQRKRLYTIATNHQVPDADVKRIMLAIAGVDSSKQLPAAYYDTVVAEVEAWVPVEAAE